LVFLDDNAEFDRQSFGSSRPNLGSPHPCAVFRHNQQ
jgi:hypothetical protein